MFFKIFPISNTSDSITYILATVHFLYPKLGFFSDMEYYFYQLAYQDSKVSERFVGLNQILCSRLLTGTGADRIKGNASGTHQSVGGVTETTICMGSKGAQPPLNPYQRGDAPL